MDGHRWAEEIASLVRSYVEREIERIGVDDFAERLGVPPTVLRQFADQSAADLVPGVALGTSLAHYDYSEFADLRRLMAAFLNEDYSVGTGSADEWRPAVDAFVRDSTKGQVRGAIRDADILLEGYPEHELRAELELLGCGFGRFGPRLTVTQWVRAVRDRMAAALVETSRDETQEGAQPRIGGEA
jgi:hypothetical protein